jgi:hypothetical protein
MRASLIAFLIALPILAAERPTDAEVKAVVAENLKATQASDLDAIRATIHPDSIAQNTIGQAAAALSAYKLKYEAVSVGFIGMVDDYALIRVVQRTTRVAGPDFLDNEIDGIWALRLDGTKWKYWTQMALKLRPLSR